MKILKLVSISILVLACGCTTLSSTPTSGNPDWLSTRITQLQNAPTGNPPYSIWQYEYNGKTFYYLPPQCCDQFSQLYDAMGNLICAPDGGFSGMGDGKCPKFIQLRKNEILIWRDPRIK